MKHIVALILVLALANPFCCCYSVASESSSKTPSPTQTQSCCSQQGQSSEGESEEDGEFPSEKICPCKAPVALADEVDHFKVLRVNIHYIATHEVDRFEIFDTTESSVTLGKFIGQPPPQSLALFKQYCVCRI